MSGEADLQPVETPSAEPVATPEVVAPVTEAAPDNSTPENAARNAFKEVSERARDPMGRFAPKTAEAPVEAAPAQTKNPDEPPKVAQPSPKDRSAPPPGFTPEAKAEWPSLSPAQKAAAWVREDNYADGISKKNRELEGFAPVKALLDQNAERFARLNVDAPTALRQLLSFQDQFERDPATLIRHVANLARIDLRQLAQTPTASASPAAAAQPARPNVAHDIPTAVSQEVDRREAQRAINDFFAKPEHKHASDPAVKQAMAAQLQAGAKDLPEAYDRAVWSLPHLRDGLLADREAEAAKAKADKVAAAQRAAVSMRPGAPSNGVRPASLAAKPASGISVEDAARAAYAQHAGGGR